MDALEYARTIARICNYQHNIQKNYCLGCPLYFPLARKSRCQFYEWRKEDEAFFRDGVAIVEKWAKDHPEKTRKTEFLKMFPNADIDNIMVCDLDKKLVFPHCGDEGCDDCKRDFWNEEVSE